MLKAYGNYQHRRQDDPVVASDPLFPTRKTDLLLQITQNFLLILLSFFWNFSSLYIVSVAALSSVAPQPCCVIGKATQAEQTMAI